jgi:hypothetical protein
MRRLEVEEQRERFYGARRTGGQCAACGRLLDGGETVYMEASNSFGFVAVGPVGVDCVSEELLDDARGQEPERCTGCGRGVHYWRADRRRRRVSCSKRCAIRAAAIEHRTARV